MIFEASNYSCSAGSISGPEVDCNRLFGELTKPNSASKVGARLKSMILILARLPTNTWKIYLRGRLS